MRKKLIILASLVLVANQIVAKETDTLEKEVLIFTNGQYIKGKNKKIREVKFKNWINTDEEIIPPGKPEGSTTTIPGTEIIPPGKPGGPTTTIPGTEIIPPGKPGGPTTTVPEKQWELGGTYHIYKNKIEELQNTGVLIEHQGKKYAVDRDNKIAYEIIEKPVVIWEEGKNIYSDNYSTTKDLKSIYGTSALKINGGIAINKHTITTVSGTQAIHVTKGTGINEGTIEATIGSGILSEGTGIAINKGNIDINSTAGNGLISKQTGTILNDTTGVITLNNGSTAMTIKDSGTGENKGKLVVNHTNAQAVSVFGGKFVNNGIIENNSNFLGQGIFTRAGEVENNGIINMNGNSGTGIFARDNAKLINSGTINLNSTSNTGISVLGANVQAINTNTGVINLNGTNGVGVSISEGAKFTNNGQIVIKAGTTGNREIVNNGGIILNKGLIKSNGVFEIDSNGIFEIGKNGVIEAKEVIGNIKLSNDLTFNNYSDVISEEILKTENYQGNISSDSVLYSTTTEKTENGYLVTLERKEFTGILENKGLGNYLESNYTNGSTEKDKLFNELKLSKNEKSLNEKINNVFGNNILPNLKKQTLDLIKYTKDTLVKNVFKSKATKEIRTIAGYDYKKNEIKSSENLSGYDESINSIFLGVDKEVAQNLRVGGILTIGELNSNYTFQNANRKDSNLQANIFTQYEKNGLNYVFNGFIGGTNGELKRKVQLETINSKLSTNLESRYIGFNNIITKKIDKNGFILEPQIQINATYLKMNGLDESGEFGIKTSKENIKSFEVGTGVILERSFATNEYVITPKLGANYFYEFGNPYKVFDGQMLDISTDKFEISKNSIDRGRTELILGVDIEKGNLKIYGDYKYLVEREENLLSAGLIYKFN